MEQKPKTTSITTGKSNLLSNFIFFMRRTLTFLVGIFLCSISFTSCRKNHDDGIKPPPENLELINTGYYFDVNRMQYIPVYWKREKMFVLTVPEERNAYPYGITQQGSDLIITGTYSSDDELTLFPCYWRNGIKIDLPFDQLEPFERCVAKDAIVWNNKIYILGAVDLRPVLWIVENNNIRQIAIDKTPDTRSASNLHLYKNELYIGGDKSVEQDNGKNFSVGYWKLNDRGIGTWHEIEKGMKYATAFYLNTSSGKVFISGERNVLNNNNLDSYMTLWSQSGKIDLDPVDIPAAYRLSTVQNLSNGQLLLNAYDFKTHRPLVFRADENGHVLENIRPEIPTGFRGYCTNLAVENGRVAMGGYYHNGSQQILWFKTADDAFELEQPAGAVTSVNRSAWIRK
jgi:hypothetical protein